VGEDTVARTWRPELCGRGGSRRSSSDDSHIEAKLLDVVGLYVDPPERAVVLCFDEKSRWQALERTQPSLRLTPGRAGR
jgi:hypothetical protein